MGAQGDGVEGPDADLVSVLTGIQVGHLRSMLAGEALPTWTHEEQLRRLPDGMAPYRVHRQELPAYEVTAYGRAPSGTRLRYLPAAEVRRGDQIGYRPPKKIYGQAWVAVDAVVQSGAVVAITLNDGVEMRVSSDAPVVVARPIEETG